ncbi:RluA family pseudouridine synthase [Helicobacter baculiformis]|uniref:RNA pseudouridylate synthase n=1 Tax=Helicobacter baculiformis TaxID=427351 RepID=A0ABV7ZFJ5_9HELI|nr:RluA family pseudouridine synthase [Helicobacter baculiformis]
MQKAYKLLSVQLGISHNQAKSLIDLGRVRVHNKPVKLARTLLPLTTRFEVLESVESSVLYQDDTLLAICKSSGVDSYRVQDTHAPYQLLHRLDKPTSGVLLLACDPFYTRALLAFKQRGVYKEYCALVEGIVRGVQTLRMPLRVQKSHAHAHKGFVKSLCDPRGKEAITHITPLKHYPRHTLLKVVLETGVTHQIRAHLSAIKHPIVGDTLYGAKPSAHLFLHAKRVQILGYDLQAPTPPYFDLGDGF